MHIYRSYYWRFCCADQSKTVHVKIQLNKECSFGEQFVVVGDDPIFGMWDPENAIPLNWSDGHVWILELDIPIGQTIQFKFILKEITGKISWQPGPDRVLKTWETNNTIVVCEDWEDATFQKLLEEEPNCNQNEEPTDNSEMLIVAENLTIVSENLTVQNEEFVANVNNGAVTANVTSLSAKEPLSSDHEKSFITEDLSSSQEKNIAIVDDNSGNSKADPAVSSSHQKLGEKIINHETDGNEALAEEMLGRNGKAPICENSVGTDIEENLINHVGEPVLVPGLPPLSVDSSEPEIQDEDERSSSFVASVGAVEVEDRNPPEVTT
ncbi:catalytic, putative [Ricinus communis]|uniref:Catalytic, putative n=1 Tax=Ricinus communis TaxID=3988 RepID=B9SQ50_RICCO|nr:catalytic, putative [Ricinus communis]